MGEVVNRDHPESPPFQPPALPAFQAADAGHMLQLYISRYVFNSGAWVFFQVRRGTCRVSPFVCGVCGRVHVECVLLVSTEAGAAHTSHVALYSCVVCPQAGLEKFVVTPAMMPSGVPVSLNTSSPVFKSVAPGMAAKYPNVG